jgi:hypothetical protein
VVAEELANLDGGIAAVLGRVRPAVAQGVSSLDEARVITVGILPAAFGRMRGRPVQFDGDSVLLIEIVQVPVTGTTPALGLAPCLGQAVGTFDTVDVVAFEWRVDSLVGIVEGLRDPGAPPYPATPGQRLPQ